MMMMMIHDDDDDDDDDDDADCRLPTVIFANKRDHFSCRLHTSSALRRPVAVEATRGHDVTRGGIN